MEIKTKYNIGDKIWIIYEASYRNSNNNFVATGEVSIYDTEISNIFIDQEGIFYCGKDGDYEEIKEKDIIPYEDKEKLLQKIEEVLDNIHKRENGNLQSS